MRAIIVLISAGIILSGLARPAKADDDLREYLFDGCNDLEIMAPIFWQPAWNPRGYEDHRAGKLSIDNEASVQGSGSIAWTVTENHISEVLSREEPPEFIMFNRLFGQNWGDVREVRFHVKSMAENSPPIFVQLVGHGRAPERTVVKRGEMTGGWKEIRWDVEGLDLGEHEEYGTRLWYFRIGARTEALREGDSIDIRLDNIRFVAAPGEDVSEVPGEMELPSGESYAVWPMHYAAKGSVHSVPETGDPDSSMRLFATPGEHEPASFAVRPLSTDLSGVHIRLSRPLETPEGEVISARQVDIRTVRSMTRWLNPDEYLPEETYLVPAEPLDIPKGTTQRYWLTVQVSEDAEPGVYTTSVLIEPETQEAASLELAVEVLPFRLADVEDIAFFMYHSPHLLPEKFRTIEYQHMLYADMAEHGMTTVTGYFRPSGDILHGAHPDYLPMAPLVEAMDSAGLPAGENPLVWVGAESYGGDVWQAVLDAGREHGYPELLFYMIDEPSPGRYPAVESVMARLNEFREAHPEYDIRTTTALGPQAIEDVGHYYDIWILGGGAVRDGMAEEAAAQGRELWAYECHFSPTQPEISRYYFGFWAWSAGLRGVSYWAYYDGGFYSRFGSIGSHEDVEEDWLEWTNQFSFVYPTAEGPIPTIGWAAVRQGIDDYRYLRTLEAAIEAAKDNPTARETVRAAEDLLAEIRSAINLANYRQPIPPELADRPQADIFDRPRPEEDLLPEDYDRLRRRIADKIIALKGP